MLALPPALLDQLGLAVRDTVGVAVEAGRLIVKKQDTRPKYRLVDLLAEGVIPCSGADLDWTASAPVGRELI